MFDETKFKTINDFIATLDYDSLLKQLKTVKSVNDLYSITEDKVLAVFS